MPGLNSSYLTTPSILAARQIQKGLIDVNHGLSYTDFMEYIGDYEKVKSPKFWHVQNSSSVGVGDTTGSTPTGSGTQSITVATTAQTQGYFRKDDVVKLKNNKNALVYSVVTSAGQDTHVLKSLDGGNLVLAAGDPLVYAGVAIPEGGLPRIPVHYPVTAIFNLIQSFGETLGSTDISQMQDVEVVMPDGSYKYFSEDKVKGTERVLRGINGTMIGGQISTAQFSDGSASSLLNADGKPTQTMMGMDQATTTYGTTLNANTSGFFGLVDMQNIQAANIASKVTDTELWVLGGSVPRTEFDIYFKGLNSSGVESARINMDGKDIDFMVDKYTFGGFTYYFRTLNTFNDQEMFPLNGSNIAKSTYILPKGKLSTTVGPKPYFVGMYFSPNDINYPVTGAKLQDMVYEMPIAFTGERVVKSELSSYQSVDWLGAKFFTKMIM